MLLDFGLCFVKKRNEVVFSVRLRYYSCFYNANWVNRRAVFSIWIGCYLSVGYGINDILACDYSSEDRVGSVEGRAVLVRDFAVISDVYEELACCRVGLASFRHRYSICYVAVVAAYLICYSGNGLAN